MLGSGVNTSVDRRSLGSIPTEASGLLEAKICLLHLMVGGHSLSEGGVSSGRGGFPVELRRERK